jgi:hypothetical protein
MLSALTDQPAYILSRRWDVLHWNRAAELVFCDYSKLLGDERNCMHLIFVDPDHRRLLVDWEAIAQLSIAIFRAGNAQHAGDVAYQRLVSNLAERNEEFRRWWQQHDVLQYASLKKRIDHPTAGRMEFEFNSFTADDGSGVKLVVYTPLEEEQTRDKMRNLLT